MPVIKEYEELPECLGEDELSGLKAFALANQTDQQGNHRPVFVLKNNRLQAQNYVGIIETRKRDADAWLVAIRKKLNFFKKCDQV